MRILHLLKTSNGASWAQRQMRELVKLGHEIHVVLPRGGRLLNEYRRDNINIHFLDINFLPTKAWQFSKMVFSLREIINKLKPDLVHSHFVNTTLVARAALWNTDIPLLFQVPGPLHLENPLISRLGVFLSRNKDYWGASSDFIRKRYLKLGVDKKRLFYAPYSPDISRFIPKDKYQARKSFGFDYNNKFIGMVAYFYPPRFFLGYTRGIKGHEDLIDAVALSLKERNDINCLMVGGPYNNRAKNYMKKVQKYAKEKCESHIIFLGELNDIPEILACLDIAIVPSLSENYGGVGEALLMEIPTIATSVGGIPEIIKHGKTGFLVPKKSPNLIYEYINYIFKNEDEAKKIAKAGRDLILNLFDPCKTAKKISSIYVTIADKNNKFKS